jgi:putative ABC transport system permease protein
LVAVSNLIAWPAAYFIMKQWLQGFAYRIGITPEVFLLSGCLSLLLALFTVAYHSIKAAVTNPVESLRHE